MMRWKQAVWVQLASLACGLMAASPAVAQGWPALEVADFKAVGGGAQDAAVLIGIDDYAFMPDVVGAEANARAWEQWLRKGRQVPGSNIRRLLGADVDRSQVQRAVDDAVRRVGKDGTLYFVFVGHGAPARRQENQEAEPFLLLGDTKKSLESFAQRGVGVESELSVWLRPAAAKGAKVVAVLDACFTGKAQGGGDLIAGAQFAALSSMAAPAALTLLSATSSKDITGPLPGGARPAFSYLVLAALRGWGDQNTDGTVTVQEAVDFAATVMLDAQRPEQPSFSGKNVDLAKSGGERVPAYRNWLGWVATAPVVRAPILGAENNIATLAAQADRLEAEHKAAEEAARAKAERLRVEAERKASEERRQADKLVATKRRAEEAAAALAEAKAAESKRLVAEAQAALDQQAQRDFAPIERFVRSPSDLGRPALEAYLSTYGDSSMTVDGVRHRLAVGQVGRVRAALASPTTSAPSPSTTRQSRLNADELSVEEETNVGDSSGGLGLGLGVGGAAVAALGAGVALNVLARDLVNSTETVHTDRDAWRSARVDLASAETMANWSYVMLGLGGVAAGLALWLAIDNESSSVMLVPIENGGTLTCTGRWSL